MKIKIDWNKKRSSTYGWVNEDCDCLIEALSYEIIKKRRNDKFFVKATQWQSDVRLPFREFDTAKEAQDWCVEYETARQEKALNEEREEIYF